MYQLTKENISIKRIADNAFIPFDDANTDFVEYQKWLAEGNEPLPADSVTVELTASPNETTQ